VCAYANALAFVSDDRWLDMLNFFKICIKAIQQMALPISDPIWGSWPVTNKSGTDCP